MRVVEAMGALEEMRVEEVQEGLQEKLELEEKKDFEKRGDFQQMGYRQSLLGWRAHLSDGDGFQMLLSSGPLLKD